MASAKLLLLVAITAALLMAASSVPIKTGPDSDAMSTKKDSIDYANYLLDSLVPIKTGPHSEAIRIKEGYRFTNFYPGPYRQETGIILNPGTNQQELNVRGDYTVNYEKADSHFFFLMYTADRNGYKASYFLEKIKHSGQSGYGGVGVPGPVQPTKLPIPQEPKPISSQCLRTLVGC